MHLSNLSPRVTRPANTTSSTPRPTESASAKIASIVSFETGRSIDPAVAERRRQDRKLVEAILAGDSDAFSELHALYSQRLYRFAMKRLGDPTEAEDVVQDVFLEIHRCLKSWEGRSALLTWMFGITHHQICRRFRRKSPVSVSLEHLETIPPIAPEVPNDRRVDAVRVLEVCAETLEEDVSPAQREIFDLYYGENRPTKRIAEELGKSNQAIKISLFRTRRAIEARLEEREMLQTA